MIINEFNKTVAEQIFGRKTKLVSMVGHDLTNHLNSKRWYEYHYSDLESGENNNSRLPNYLTNVNDDLLTLKYISQTWQNSQIRNFNDRIEKLWYERQIRADRIDFPLYFYYEPGDYSKIALMIVQNVDKLN